MTTRIRSPIFSPRPAAPSPTAPVRRNRSTAPSVIPAAGKCTVGVEVTDPAGHSEIGSVDVLVVNTPPVITTLTATPASVSVNAQSILRVLASDLDNDPLTYGWTATCGTLSSAVGAGDKTWTAPAAVPAGGKCTVTVTVTDPSGANAIKPVDIRVTAGITYRITQLSAGGWTFSGSFTTDGTIGLLRPSNIVSSSVQISNGATTIVLGIPV